MLFGNSEQEIESYLGAAMTNPEKKKKLIREIKDAGFIKLSTFLTPAQRDIALRRSQFSQETQKLYDGDGGLVDRPIQYTFIGKSFKSGGQSKIVLLQKGQPAYKGMRGAGADGFLRNNPMVLRAINIKAATQSTRTDKSDDPTVLDEFQSLNLESIESVNSILPKGRFFLKVANKDAFQEGYPMSNFADLPITQKTGLHELDATFVILDQKSLEIYAEFDSNVPQGTFLEVTLIGMAPQPALI